MPAKTPHKPKQQNASTNAFFARAAVYRSMLDGATGDLREPAARRKAFCWSERHIHCAWFDPALRPPILHTRSGETVQVENPGLWNREAGPDFLGAVLLIGPDRRRVAGDLEVHIHPADWKAHGHHTDARYRQVRFHLTYFRGADGEIDPAPGTLQIVLKDALAACPGFSFDHVDVAAYPYAARADRPPCSLVLKAYSPDARTDVLRAAGEERLRRKAERMAALIQEKGADQVLYEEVMAALGYKHNKNAFRQVAVTLPLDELRGECGGDPKRAYALVSGVSGLLPEQPSKRWDQETTHFLRALWDVWWRYRARYTPSAAPPKWRLDGVRPANHPLRRLMASAQLFGGKTDHADFVRRAATLAPVACIRALTRHYQDLNDTYWSNRLGFCGAPRASVTALIGPQRTAAIVTNVLAPWLAVQGLWTASPDVLLDVLPSEPDNGVTKQTAFYLFGRDHSPGLYRSAIARQGLVQIFQDFCLNDRSRCATCPFPTALTRHLQQDSP